MSGRWIDTEMLEALREFLVPISHRRWFDGTAREFAARDATDFLARLSATPELEALFDDIAIIESEGAETYATMKLLMTPERYLTFIQQMGLLSKKGNVDGS